MGSLVVNTQHMYKIGLVANQMDDSRLDAILDYFNDFLDKRTALSVQVDVIRTDFDNIEHKVFKQTSRGYDLYGTVNGKELSRSVVENDGTYHQVVFLYDAEKTKIWDSLHDDNNRAIKENGYLTSWSFHNELYVDTEYTEVEVNNTKAEGLKKAKTSFTHEFMHALVKRAQRNGRNGVVDHMDKTVVNGEEKEYYKNSDPFHEDGNYSRTLAELEDHWDVVLGRDRYNKEKLKLELQAEILKKQLELQLRKTRGYMENPTQIVAHHGDDARPLKLIEALVIYQETHHKNLYLASNQPRSPFVPLTEQERIDVWNYLKWDKENGKARFDAILESGWRDIAYHTIVCSDGWRPVRPTHLMGYHAGNWPVNQKSLANCTSGDYNEIELSPEMYQYMTEAMAFLKESEPTVVEVSAHRDHTSTKCCGKNMTDEIITRAFEGRPMIDTPVETTIDEEEKNFMIEMGNVFNKYPSPIGDRYRAVFLPEAQKHLQELIDKKNENK